MGELINLSKNTGAIMREKTPASRQFSPRKNAKRSGPNTSRIIKGKMLAADKEKKVLRKIGRHVPVFAISSEARCRNTSPIAEEINEIGKESNRLDILNQPTTDGPAKLLKRRTGT